jgi:transposase InsO family protein
VDVKFLPKLGRENKRYYQFTAIDDCTRYRVLQIYSHNSAKSAVDFIERVRQKLPFAIQEIQTDNGSEFGTSFTWHLNDLGITHRRIAPGCPEQNGKVERSHRTDQEEFYRDRQFRDEQELKRRLEDWEREYNFERPHMGLGGIPPAERMHQKIRAKNFTRPVQKVA